MVDVLGTLSCDNRNIFSSCKVEAHLILVNVYTKMGTLVTSFRFSEILLSIIWRGTDIKDAKIDIQKWRMVELSVV